MLHAYFLLIFLVLFPKGGIKAGGTPLTWGYLYLAMTAPFLAMIRLLATPLRVRGSTLIVVGLLVPMQILLAYAFATGGTPNAGYAVSMVVGLTALPWIFLLVYPPFLPLLNAQSFSRCFRWCVLLAAAWGIFLFFLHPLTGHYIEIPYLTVNAADAGLLESTKHNSRGFFQKLISTYNNGNLYGVATLILMPLYNVLEPSRWKRGVLFTAALLTLSRTVWVGLIIMQVGPLALLLAAQIRTFPVLHLGAATRRVFSVIAIVGLVLVVLFFATNSGLEFLLDPTLGGRASEIRVTSGISVLPPAGLQGFDESLYGSAIKYYGIAGIVAFTSIMFSPLLVLAWDTSALRSPLRMAAFSGLMLYALLAASDGAFVLIPVMAFYWFVYTVFLHGWPGTQKEAGRQKAARPRTVSKPCLVMEPS